MTKGDIIIGFICLACLFLPTSCIAEEKYLPGGPYYYAEFSGYNMPPHPLKKLIQEEALKRDVYYIAYFDERERLISFTKYYKGRNLFSSKYFYRPSGILERRESIDEIGETKIYFYDEEGKPIE